MGEQSLYRLLERVGLPDEQMPDAISLLRSVLADDGALARAGELAHALRGRIGDVFDRNTVFADGDLLAGPGRGAVPLLALLATVDDIDRHWQSLGFSDAARSATAGEIARQIDKATRVTGALGLTDFGWVEVVWRGGFAQVGRLQYELVRDGQTVALNTHIPEGGPLRPELVVESLRDGRDVFNRAFPDLAPIHVAVCDSWLLDPQLGELVAGSNVATFGALWELEDSGPGDDDALFFIFDLPRGSAAELPTIAPGLRAGSRLQAAVLELWERGGSLRHWKGRIDLTSL